jgi:hypothetical protein
MILDSIIKCAMGTNPKMIPRIRVLSPSWTDVEYTIIIPAQKIIISKMANIIIIGIDISF